MVNAGQYVLVADVGGRSKLHGWIEVAKLLGTPAAKHHAGGADAAIDGFSRIDDDARLHQFGRLGTDGAAMDTEILPVGEG